MKSLIILGHYEVATLFFCMLCAPFEVTHDQHAEVYELGHGVHMIIDRLLVVHLVNLL